MNQRQWAMKYYYIPGCYHLRGACDLDLLSVLGRGSAQEERVYILQDLPAMYYAVSKSRMKIINKLSHSIYYIVEYYAQINRVIGCAL